MSVKAWITEIRNMEEWEEFDAAFVADMEKVDEHGNRDGHECWWEYAVKLHEDMGGGFTKIEAGTVMVAWSADSGVYLPVIRCSGLLGVASAQSPHDDQETLHCLPPRRRASAMSPTHHSHEPERPAT